MLKCTFLIVLLTEHEVSCTHISLLPDRLHLGNKSDLEQERQVQFEEACNLAKERGILAALETSAKVTRVTSSRVDVFEVE